MLPVDLKTLLPGVNQSITLAQQVALATNADVYGRQANFVFAFTGALTWTKFVPGTLDYNTGSATPDWEGKKPFFASLGKDQQNNQTKSAQKLICMYAPPYRGMSPSLLILFGLLPYFCPSSDGCLLMAQLPMRPWLRSAMSSLCS